MSIKSTFAFPACALVFGFANACRAVPDAPARAPAPAGNSTPSTSTLDTKAPTMSSFDAETVVDVTNGDAALVVRFSAKDDLSGVWLGEAHAVGPGGQDIVVEFSESFPTKELSGHMVSPLLPSMLEPGEYVFKRAEMCDVAGNTVQYEAAALAALGRGRFVVKNRRGHDATPPALVAGKVLTPRLSASEDQPGVAGLEPRLGVWLDTLDRGNAVVAGVRMADADFCLVDQSECLSVRSDDSGQPGRAAISLRLGSELSRKKPAGEYRLRTIHLVDFARNETTLTSTAFGGTTDFSAYFASTTITITP